MNSRPPGITEGLNEGFCRSVGAAKVGQGRPAPVGKGLLLEKSVARIARENVKMHMRVDHHQHEIIDPLIPTEPAKSPFNSGNQFPLLDKRVAWKVAIAGFFPQCAQNEAAKRRLRGTHQDRPMASFVKEIVGVAELDEGRVRGVLRDQLSRLACIGATSPLRG